MWYLHIHFVWDNELVLFAIKSPLIILGLNNSIIILGDFFGIS